ncbi:helix-turn-helix transcriptional regulator [Afifella sp. JA880]|uniref:winged helix-turn-helix transcriptional regulator n=1 Tax=Afifella sp. JA880 TaxID=2975280 RepID=UPI0021BACEBD|nr:helix-turn-helix domain-containing protein [Afifella sp. JA880]MCT8267816.1 helix-turn-helix transcriptional regulator [Afifella sp. JA880]
MAYSEEDVLRTLPGVRPVLEQVAQKWTILILTFLCEEPKRFNALKRRLDGISQKALTDALRRLERNGLVQRTVTTSSPIAVEYSVTPLGRTLQEPFLALYDWAVAHQDDLCAAREAFDQRHA